MANITISPNMSLPIPIPGVDPGPDYAQNLNASLTILDSHNHAAGSGVQITPAGLNINSDLPLNQNNLTLARSLRLFPNTSPLALGTDLDCLYTSGVDLYYNDGSGNQVRITQSGGVAGSPGSIANLTSPASATYVAANQTFVWQSAASTPANLDAASVVFRNLTASSQGITVSPPNALGSSYALVLPPLPVSQKFMTLDASGNISAPWAVDGSTVEIASSSTLQVKASGITTTQLANGSVTPAKKSALGLQTSASSGSYTSSSTSFVQVTNLSVTITTTGRPVFVGLIADPSTFSTIVLARANGVVLAGTVAIVSGATPIAQYALNSTLTTGAFGSLAYPVASISTIDSPSAGSQTYTCQVQVLSGSQFSITNCRLIAYEL